MKHHWLEESQHTKLDTLIVEALAETNNQKEIEQAFQDYADIGGFLDNGIKQQTEFDVESFVQATGRNLSKSDREAMSAVVLKGMRWTYLGTGMTHPNFRATVEEISPEGKNRSTQWHQCFVNKNANEKISKRRILGEVMSTAETTKEIALTKDVLEHHLKCFGERDLKGILSDYAPGAVLFTSDGPLREPMR